MLIRLTILLPPWISTAFADPNGFVKRVSFCQRDAGRVFYRQGQIQSFGSKKSHLVKILHNNMDRCEKNRLVRAADPSDTADRETWRLYGELLTANIHALKTGMKAARVLNYYAEEEQYVEIPLTKISLPLTTRRCIIRYQKEKPSTNIR